MWEYIIFTSRESIIEWLNYCFENSFFVNFRDDSDSKNAEWRKGVISFQKTLYQAMEEVEAVGL